MEVANLTKAILQKAGLEHTTHENGLLYKIPLTRGKNLETLTKMTVPHTRSKPQEDMLSGRPSGGMESVLENHIQTRLKTILDREIPVDVRLVDTVLHVKIR